MGITPRFTASDVNSYLQQALLEIDGQLLEIMKYTGETFVENARNAMEIDGRFTKGDYKDDTANLRSSIGYVVLKDGNVVFESFPGGAAKGHAEGKSLAMSLRKDGYQLIGVAGMDYASAVEARGYNVITSQADYALIDLTDTLKRLSDRYSKRGIGLSNGDIAGSTSASFR